VVEAVLDEQRLLVGLGGLLASSSVLGSCIKASLLLLLGLGAVLVQELEELRCSVLVEGV
jgi:hypothetical protein